MIQWENLTKGEILGGVGIIGSAIAELYGGWTQGMTTLVILMIIDYIMGILVAGVFGTSKKSEDGKLESRAGWKGLVRKGVTLLIVLVATRIDLMLESNFVRDAAVIGFAANELLSIVENAGLMGVPMPAAITNAVEVLQNKAKVNNKE